MLEFMFVLFALLYNNINVSTFSLIIKFFNFMICDYQNLRKSNKYMKLLFYYNCSSIQLKYNVNHYRFDIGMLI